MTLLLIWQNALADQSWRIIIKSQINVSLWSWNLFGSSNVFIIHMYAHSQAGWVWWIKPPEKYRQNFNVLNEGPLLEMLNVCLYFSGIWIPIYLISLLLLLLSIPTLTQTVPEHSQPASKGLKISYCKSLTISPGQAYTRGGWLIHEQSFVLV